MTRVKICGLTNLADARLALDAGADALGFIAVPGGPRFVSPESFATIRRKLPPFVTVVVVARTVAESVGYDADRVQFYGGPASGKCVRVFRVRGEESLQALSDYDQPVSAVHLDTFHERSLGGVGAAFDWNLAVAAKSLRPGLPLILAGGLTPENVSEAIARVRPYAVDVSSGVESAPGRKDPEKLRRFVAAVREADAR